MIGFIRGTVIYTDPLTSEIIVEAGQSGVGYRLLMVQRDAESILTGDAVALFVSTQVREDEITLYAFHTQDARRLFQALIRLNRVGPKLALAILNAYTPAELREIGHMRNDAALKAVPGIGAQIAAKLAIDLEKLFESFVLHDAETTSGSSIPTPAARQPHADTHDALVYLGYSENAIEAVLQQLDQENPALGSVEEEVRWALRLLK